MLHHPRPRLRSLLLVPALLMLILTASLALQSENRAHATLVVEFSKQAEPTSGPAPLTVTYTYQLRNLGVLWIYSMAVVDDRCAPVQYVSGDAGSDSVLKPGEQWTFTCTETLAAPGSYTNTAVVRGTAHSDGSDVRELARDSATVSVGGGATPTPTLVATIYVPLDRNLPARTEPDLLTAEEARQIRPLGTNGAQALIGRRAGIPQSVAFRNLPATARKLLVINLRPGLTNLRITVNGKLLNELSGLRAGEERTVDLSAALVSGNRNTVVLTALGTPGGSAYVIVWDGS